MQQQLATAPTDNPPPIRSSQTIAWTPAQVDFLRMRWAEKATAAQIADELGFGCTANMVIGKANRIGLETRQRPKPARAGAADLARAQAASAPRPARPAMPKPKPPAPRPIVEALPRSIRCEPVPEGGIEIHALEMHHCRWIVGGEAEHARYCGAARLEGKAFAYCAQHYAIAAVPAGSSRVEREIRAAMRGRG